MFLDELLERRRPEPALALVIAVGSLLVARDLFLSPDALLNTYVLSEVKWPENDARQRPEGELKNPKPAVPDVITKRRRPGEDLLGAERKEALQWANEQWRNVAEETFKYRTCNYCHIVIEDDESETPSYSVEPVRIADRWFPKGIFTHSDHSTAQTTCVDCHEAETSEQSADVLLPGIQSCFECHGGPDETSKLASQCVDCHKFHIVEGQFMGHPPVAKKGT